MFRTYGLSVCHINKSFEIINNTKYVKKGNEVLGDSFMTIKSLISQLKDKYNDENNNIYHEYESEPNLTIETRVLTKITPYEVPEKEEIKLTVKKEECSIL